jgi:hypothetical protein
MSRSDIPPTNKKAIKCEDCGKWVTLQGYGGHRRFYHGEYQKNLKQQLLSRLINLRTLGKVSKLQYETMSQALTPDSKSTMKDIEYIKNFVDSIV